MAENRHLRDKKITIMQLTTVQDEDGFDEEKLIPLPGGENIWAYYRHTSANEFYAAHTTNIKVEVIFEIAWRNDIDTYCKIKYKDKDYDITRIDDYEGRKQTLRIYAYKVN
ncbi:head-tail adaptor protein [Clostridium sporogenes]|uniref:phage head closure protein n=1 Tax=Clostridium sporogenes TaxID=1509 RepID=UPI0013D12517|nr:phage head closure protein [Clostridium sporogenes]NFL77875.1 head-tail adaptor protein [Clostridium sporogenes]